MKQQNHRPERTHRNPQAAILSLLFGLAMLLIALAACTPNSDLDPAAPDAPAPGAVTTLIGTKPAYTPLPATRTATTDNGAWQTGDQVTVSIRFYTTPDAPADATPAAKTQQTLTYAAPAADAPTAAARWTASPAIVAIPAAARSMRVDYTYQGTADPITTTCERMQAYVSAATGSAISPDKPGDIFRPDADANDRLIPIGNVSGTLTLTPAFERLTALVSLDMQPGQHVLLTTALPQPEQTPGEGGLYTLSARIDATAQPATAHFHLMATAADAPTFGLRIEGEKKTAYPAVPYRTGWKYHLDARSILGSGGNGEDQQFVTADAEEDELDPEIFNAQNPVWIITGGGGDDADVARRVTDKVKSALQGLPAGSIELVLADVKTVGERAFIACTALNSVSLPAATSIGQFAFQSCTALATVNLPATVTAIENYTFYGCAALATIDLTAAKSIGVSAFVDCTALTNIDLTAAKSIGVSAFVGCTALTTIDLKAAESIGEQAFQNCTALATVTLPATITAIKAQVFLGCEALTTIDLKAAKSIGQQAFGGCAALTTVVAPQVNDIGMNAFANCTKLTTLQLTAPGNITLHDYAFGNFTTAACTLTLNPDKKNGAAGTPKVEGGDKWWKKDSSSTLAQWLQIDYLTTVSLPGITDGGTPY